MFMPDSSVGIVAGAKRKPPWRHRLCVLLVAAGGGCSSRVGRGVVSAGLAYEHYYSTSLAVLLTLTVPVGLVPHFQRDQVCHFLQDVKRRPCCRALSLGWGIPLFDHAGQQGRRFAPFGKRAR